MIFFGTKEKEIKKGKIANIVCPECNDIVSMNYLIESKYFHLYWIPFFPYKKITFAACTHCEAFFESKNFTESIKNKLKRENELKPSKFPLWMFSGSIVLAILIPLAIMQSSKADVRKEDYTKNPKIGDVYFLNPIPSKYTTMKIAAIEKDSIHFIINDTSVTKFKKIFSINRDNYYSDKTKSYSKTDLINLLKNDSIYTIDRN